MNNHPPFHYKSFQMRILFWDYTRFYMFGTRFVLR